MKLLLSRTQADALQRDARLAVERHKRVAECLLEVLDEPDRFRGDIESIQKSYKPDSIAAEYERLFQRLMNKGR